MPQTPAVVANTDAAVFRIDLARTVRRAAPATQPVSHGGRVHCTAALKIVGKALDAGIFYQDEFRKFCREEWEKTFPAVDVCITANGVDNWVEMAAPGEAYISQRHKLHDQLKASPRGTWALLCRTWERAGTTYVVWQPMISDGFGGVHEPQSISSGHEPCHATCASDLVDMDIYLARKAEEYRREMEHSASLIRERGWRAGIVLKALKVAGKDYSSATIVDVQSSARFGANLITLQLTKRGAKARWSWTGLAQHVMVKSAPADVPAPGSVVVTRETTSGAKLFSDAA